MARDPESRVDFNAAVVARIAERELAVGPDLRIAEPHDAVADRDVAVLDHEVGGAVTPSRVERAKVLAAEAALDAGTGGRRRSSRPQIRRARRTPPVRSRDPKSVMMPASNSSLSCQSRLVT